MTGGISKPKPLKVYGRSHYACTSCKTSKIKCSGEKPCSNCKNLNKADSCSYPVRDRKIMIMESDLNKLHDKVKHYEDLFASNQPCHNTLNLYKSDQQVIQERLDEQSQELLFNNTGLEDYLVADDANEAIKWRLVNSINGRLPSKLVALKLIETVLIHYANEFYLVDVNSYKSMVEDVYAFFDAADGSDKARLKYYNDKVKRHRLCYFFILIAYGEQISNLLANQEDQIPGMQFYLMASELLNLTHEVVGLEFIQASVLMALYSANLNRYNTVYNYFGVAIRSAISLNLHRQPTKASSSDPSTLITQEKRKRVWWTVFVTDATWTSRLNHPAQIDYTETDVDLPGENSVVLNDNFEINLLEVNVQLAKYISKSIAKIYGAHMRTFTVNYINTEQFNHKKLMQDVVYCFNELVRDFEVPYLYQYKNCNVIENEGRKVVNLFLRFNLLVSMITKPLISSIFRAYKTNIFDNRTEVETLVNKSISCSVANINILLKLYEIDRLFTVGFYDSQYLFISILIIIMSCVTDPSSLVIVNQAVALLKNMANNGNINAQNCIKKLEQVNEYLSKTPELNYTLNFDIDIKDIVTPDRHFAIGKHYYNPYDDCSFASLANFRFLSTPGNGQAPVLHNGELSRASGPLDRKYEIFNPNQEIQNQSIQDKIRQSAVVNTDEPAFFASRAPIQPISRSQTPVPVSRSIYTEGAMDYNGTDPYNYEQGTTDVYTNNRVQNLSGESQNTLFALMNNLQSPEFMN